MSFYKQINRQTHSCDDMAHQGEFSGFHFLDHIIVKKMPTLQKLKSHRLYKGQMNAGGQENLSWQI